MYIVYRWLGILDPSLLYNKLLATVIGLANSPVQALSVFTVQWGAYYWRWTNISIGIGISGIGIDIGILVIDKSIIPYIGVISIGKSL